MRDAVARCVVAMGTGFALLVGLMAAQGCKKQAAPAAVQPVVRSVAQVQRDFSFGSLPVEDVGAGVTPRVDRGPRRRQQVQPVQVQVIRVPPVQVQPVQVQSSVDAQAAVAAAQREQDERLLEQQQAESDRQQEELNQDIEETLRMQEEVQAEPRIQDNPGAAQGPMETSPMPPQMLPPMPPQMLPQMLPPMPPQ
jgi:hypothetical protein